MSRKGSGLYKATTQKEREKERKKESERLTGEGDQVKTID